MPKRGPWLSPALRLKLHYIEVGEAKALKFTGKPFEVIWNGMEQSFCPEFQFHMINEMELKVLYESTTSRRVFPLHVNKCPLNVTSYVECRHMCDWNEFHLKILELELIPVF